MKILFGVVTFLLFLVSASAQSIDEARMYYNQDSMHQAMNVIDMLDQKDRNVKKLRREIIKRHKQLYSYNQLKNREYERIYGGVPTANKNMKWKDNLTPNEKYTGVIQVDSSIEASMIVDAFISTFQPLQDANLMTKQMRTNSMIGQVSSSLGGGYRSAQEFAEYGDADIRSQNSTRKVWNVQFIDGVRLYRFYYNVNVQAKDGRYKITIVPSGTSGYAQDHLRTKWSELYSNGVIKINNENYHRQIKTKLAFTVDQWINEVQKYLDENAEDSW